MFRPEMTVISVDDHIIEHRDVWQSRLPQRHREAGPRIVVVDGRERWQYEGRIEATADGASGFSAMAGTDFTERMQDPGSFDNMRPGCYDPAARLADMDADGVWAQVCFPNFSRFAGARFFHGKDKELSLLCVQAYNDFVLDEWKAAAPERYAPLIILPFWDPGLCVAEIARCAAKGAQGLTFPDNPAPMGLPSFYTDHWDGVFSAIEEAGLPICMHFGSSGTVPALASDGPSAAGAAVMGSTLFHSMTDLIFSPVFHRHPGLKVLFSEGGIGWIPFAIQRLDMVWEYYRFYKVKPTIDADVRPSDLVRRHIYGCFIDDPLGVEQRHVLGTGNLLFESDYPHSDSIWPNSHRALSTMMADVPDAEVRQMVSGNAARLFRIPLPSEHSDRLPAELSGR